MLADDPEAPTTIRRRFDYGPRTGGSAHRVGRRRPGVDPVARPAAARPGPRRRPRRPRPRARRSTPPYPAAPSVPAREASNFLMVGPKRSATSNTLAVMGPQLGYFYPEIVQQVHLSGPGIEAQGAAVPGAAMYVLIGRTPGLRLEPHLRQPRRARRVRRAVVQPRWTPPTRASTHYMFEGTCRPFEAFDAGTLNGTPIRYPRSVHGPVIGTATVDGAPYALTRQRSTFGRDGLNLAALKDMTEGKADTSRRFFRTANQFEFTFNWAYVSRTGTAYFSSGRLPERARGLDRRLPTLGTGDYEWRGFLSDRAPHDVRGPERPAAQLEQPLGARLHAR